MLRVFRCLGRLRTPILSVLLALVLVVVGVQYTFQPSQPPSPNASGRQVGGQWTITLGSASVSAAGSVDYTFDGVADDVQLQSALNALPAAGGRLVIVSATTLNLTATVTRAIANVTIEGSGRGTYFVYDGVNPIFTAGGNNWVFRDLRVDAGGITMGATTGWAWYNVDNGTNYTFRNSSVSVAGGVVAIPEGGLSDSSVVAADVKDGELTTSDLSATAGVVRTQLAAATRPVKHYVVVCASDALNTTQCDYNADGVADEVQIQAAIDGNASGTVVQLSRGTFYIAAGATINLAGTAGDKENVTLRGADTFGWVPAGHSSLVSSTRLVGGNALTNLITIDPAVRSTGYVIQGLTLVTGNHAIWGKKNISGLLINLVNINGFNGDGVRLVDDGAGVASINFGAIQLDRVFIDSVLGYGFYLDPGAGKDAQVIAIRNSVIGASPGPNAIRIDRSVTDITIEGNELGAQNTQHSIFLNGGTWYVRIANNFLNFWDSAATGNYDGIRLTGGGKNIAITGNTFATDDAVGYAVYVDNADYVTVSGNAWANMAGADPKDFYSQSAGQNAHGYVGNNNAVRGTSNSWLTASNYPKQSGFALAGPLIPEDLIIADGFNNWTAFATGGGSGGLVQDIRYGLSSTGVGGGDTAGLRYQIYRAASATADWDKNMSFEVWATPTTVSDASAFIWYMVSANDSAANPTNKAIGFRYDGNAGATWDLKGIVHDGVDFTVVNLSTNVASGTMSRLRVEFIAGTRADWFVNGSLMGSLTTVADLPSGTLAAGDLFKQAVTNGGTAADRRASMSRWVYNRAN